MGGQGPGERVCGGGGGGEAWGRGEGANTGRGGGVGKGDGGKAWPGFIPPDIELLSLFIRAE